MRALTLTLAFVALSVVAANAQERFVTSPIEVHHIASENVDQTFRIQVAVPMRTPSSADRYPVLYVTDLSVPMDALSGAISLMALAGEIPPVIVVGIGYPVDDFSKSMAVRSRDLTPVADPALASQGIYAEFIDGFLQPSEKASGGGAPEFLRFIHDELIPFVDARYPTTEDRGYFGDSLGGLFGLYVLFERPETFARYIIGSPSAWVGQEWIMTRAEEVVNGREDISARVFMAGGGREEATPELAPFRMVTNMGRLETLLRSKNFPNLRLTTHIFPDESHVSVAYMNLLRGLHKVYDPSSNAMLDAVLAAMQNSGSGN